MLDSWCDPNPILAIHDVGAVACAKRSELTNDAEPWHASTCAGAAERIGLAPKEIWCNEGQERYVLAMAPNRWTSSTHVLRARAVPVRLVGWRHAATGGSIVVALTPPLSPEGHEAKQADPRRDAAQRA